MTSKWDKIVAVSKSSKKGKSVRSRRKQVAKRPKKLTDKQLRTRLWAECKRLIRKRDKDCFTCGAKNLQGSNAQTGHFIPSSTCGVYLRYSLSNLALQCMRCNVHGGGQGAIFYRNMVQKHGQDFVDQLFKDKNKIVNARDHMLKLLEEYGKMDTQV